MHGVRGMTPPFDLRGGNVFRVQSYEQRIASPNDYTELCHRTHSPASVQTLRSSDPEIQGTQILRPSDPSDP